MQHKKFRFLRYPGGKQHLVSFLESYLPKRTELDGEYIEPFVGGGSVFFHLKPKHARLNDINSELIQLYTSIKEDPLKVWEIFSEFPSDKEGYYKVRDINSHNCHFYRAAKTLYLNRTCFKGMWRYNSQGNFNVGYGGQERRWAITQHNLELVSKRLKNVCLENQDFETIIDNTVKGDFIFLDPPYKPGERDLKDAHYTHSCFLYKDNQRLAQTLEKASARGVKWAMTTSNHPDILQLFNSKNHNIVNIPKGTGSRPGILDENPGEVLILNY